MKNVKSKGFVDHIEKDSENLEQRKVHNLSMKESITTNFSPNSETINAIIDADTAKECSSVGYIPTTTARWQFCSYLDICCEFLYY